MSNSPQFALTFSLNILNHLGIGLYSKTSAVLSELVANAWDAGATLVTITLEQEQIIIQDNGRGMSKTDINERFLRVGYQKRRDESIVTVNGVNRHVMGRKGIGKLSVFSIANVVEVQTATETEKSGFVMSLQEIEDEISRGSTNYSPIALDPQSVVISGGTKIILRELRQFLVGVEPELRTDLARRFSIIGNDRTFDVIINGRPLSLKDRNYYDKIQFMWFLGKNSAHYVQRCPSLKESFEMDNVVDAECNYNVTGWIAAVGKPKDVDDRHHAISIFAHGKLIQDDILADILEAGMHKQYLLGEIDADFMDADDGADIVTSDRQRINQNDPRYILIRAFVQKRIREIGRPWSRLRAKYRVGTKEKENLDTTVGNVAESTTAEAQMTLLNRSVDFTTYSQDAEAPDIMTGEQDPADDDNITRVASRTTEEFLPESSQVQSNLGKPILERNRPPTHEAQATFSSIKAQIETSVLEEEFRKAILYDLEQARLCYYATAYKASVIMFGAIAEGIMLATLRRRDVLEKLLTDNTPPKSLQRIPGGLHNPQYADRSIFANVLSKEFDFESMRATLQHYCPIISQLGLPDIQQFRNAIHPWRCINEPTLYGTYSVTRALQHLTALSLFTDHLLRWIP